MEWRSRAGGWGERGDRGEEFNEASDAIAGHLQGLQPRRVLGEERGEGLQQLLKGEDGGEEEGEVAGVAVPDGGAQAAGEEEEAVAEQLKVVRLLDEGPQHADERQDEVRREVEGGEQVDGV